MYNEATFTVPFIYKIKEWEIKAATIMIMSDYTQVAEAKIEDIQKERNLKALQELFSSDEERETKQIHPVSYRFVLILAIISSTIILLKNINSVVGEVDLIIWIYLTLLRFVIYNAPLLWLLSHNQARLFMKNRLKRNIINTIHNH